MYMYYDFFQIKYAAPIGRIALVVSMYPFFSLFWRVNTSFKNPSQRFSFKWLFFHSFFEGVVRDIFLFTDDFYGRQQILS